MPRTLPWLTGGVSKVTDAKGSPRRREVKQNATSDEIPKATKAPVRLEKRDFLRLSSSPPTSPIQWCPSEEYLLEGFDNDDIYMMVEDEFYAMAQTFTQHLHYAEYVKRKKEAKLQNAAAIKDLARPTDGITPISEETKRREAAAAVAVRQKAGLEKAGIDRPHEDLERQEENEENTEDDNELTGTSLGYLMTSPRKIRSLVGIQGIRSSTRAAAGYTRASGEKRTSAAGSDMRRLSASKVTERDKNAADETATEDDDLDGQGEESPPKAPRPPQIASSVKRSVSRTPAPQTTYVDVKEQQSADIRYKNKPIPKIRKRGFFDDFDELPELSEQSTPTNGRYISNTSNNTLNEKVSNLKKKRLNEVPMFLL